jgi:murein DD-endopeptidase MepM/ murein hydrolase activator NlpD
MKRGKDTRWLRALDESLPSGGPTSIIVTTAQGARYIHIDRSEVESFFTRQHRRFRGLTALFAATALALGGLYAFHEWSTTRLGERIGTQEVQLARLTGAIDEALENVRRSVTLPPLEEQATHEEAVQRLAETLARKDLAFRLYVEATRSVMQSDVEYLKENLEAVGFDLAQVQQDIAANAGPSGSIALEPVIADVLEAYMDDALRQMLDQYASVGAFIEVLPDERPLTAQRVTSRFGMRRHPLSGRTEPHRGVDLISLEDRTIFAAGPGVVTFAGRDGGYGKRVTIDHGFGLETVYAHMASIGVKVGDVVDRSDPIGVMGSTGNSAGIHLHYEVRFGGQHLDPLKVFEVARNVRQETPAR